MWREFEYELEEEWEGHLESEAVARLPPVVITDRARPFSGLNRFQFDRSSLMPFHLPTISRIANHVAASWRTPQPVRTIRLVGHADSRGPASYNLALGQRRSLTVQRALSSAIERLSPGLTRHIRIVPQSLGSTVPVASSLTEEGRARNRRVEVFFAQRAAPRPRRPRPKPSRQKPPTVPGCAEPVRVATNFKDYVALVRRAEAALIRCGHTGLEDRLHMLSGIYYGTSWSRDFDVEKSSARNAAFQIFLARPYTSGDDPRPCLGCGLFLSLKRSQDVGGVDMGHVMIGLNARMRSASRDVPIPPTRSTGLEITTWVGDLAGASARLAMDRVKAPGTPASRYFGGTDYGAPSNLEGDVAASIVDAPGLSPTAIGAPAIPPDGLISPSLESYFVKGIGRPDRCRDFLLVQGAAFSGSTLTNRNDVRDSMANKFEGFGQLYMGNFLRQRGLDALAIASIMAKAIPRLSRAASDVADLFIDKLLRCKF